ncbi:MAG: pro-sigmaK processing inhibitor BofA [Clostridia bacterium]|nr:pro-sigmaK processing inhibitor BofA [Clostridia bacterium]
MNYGIVFAAFFLLILIYIVVRVMFKPIKWLVKLIVNSILALVGIMVINIIGNYFGYHLPINPVSVIGVGVLGVPGLLLLILMNFLML